MSYRNWDLPAWNTFKPVAQTGPARAFPSIKVRIIKPFYGRGRLLEVGEVVALEEPSALGAIACKRAEKV